MPVIQISASPAQQRKLRTGKPVIVRRAVSGSGINLIVNPANYLVMSKTFRKDKGLTLTLSPEEIQSNKEESEPLEGSGIFGKKFDRLVERKLGKRLKKVLYTEAEKLKPAIKTGILGTIGAVSGALASAQPELVPYLVPLSASVASLSTDYLDNPSAYQGGKGATAVRTRVVKKYGGSGLYLAGSGLGLGLGQEKIMEGDLNSGKNTLLAMNAPTMRPQPYFSLQQLPPTH